MGYRLSNEVLDHAPDDLTPAERLVLSVLAGYVVDEATRECYPGLDNLVKRTGLKPDSLRKVFQRLAARGLDPRVSLGVDKKGRSIFAHEKVRTTYRIPKFERRDDSPATEEGPASPHSETRGGTVVPQRRDDSPSEGGSASRPKDLEEIERSLSPHLPQQTAEQPPATDQGERETIADADQTANRPTAAQKAVRGVITPDEEPAFIAWVTAKYSPDGPGWWRTVARNGDFGELAEAWRADQAPAAHGPASPGLPDWCGCGGNPVAEFNGRFRTHNGMANGQPCLICHPDALQEST